MPHHPDVGVAALGEHLAHHGRAQPALARSHTATSKRLGLVGARTPVGNHALHLADCHLLAAAHRHRRVGRTPRRRLGLERQIQEIPESAGVAQATPCAASARASR